MGSTPLGPESYVWQVHTHDLGLEGERPTLEDAFPSLGKPLLGGKQQQQQHGRGVPRRTSGEGSEKSTSSAGGASALTKGAQRLAR